MHGREGEERKPRQHMRLVLAELAPGDSSVSPTGNSFFKDGRKIGVGDCALFQAGNSPPFIGIIRRLTTAKEDYLKLGVNWLYRPADVKLCKGVLLEAAPNEVFYSFHQDEIPAAALLHPCKVAFLRKGVELPSGISAFVCRRVYDITNKRLWWLTDQDYINERQGEVDKLLEKTRLEMHAAVQSGGRSPKSLNGPTSTQQLKPGSDSAQNSTTSYPSQGKGKKRERIDQGTDPIKRERSSKVDDGDSDHFRLEGSIKAEITKITDKEGGLINFEGVEKLVNLILLDRAEKKIDLVGRIMLADVIAATEKLDCLSHFVLRRGVAVLDDWLQEAHKGKIGEGSSPKESDKSVEELLLALLRALDKLPVNLHALQTSNVGKSVNHLRSHKNLEIQKKARSLVDTWKKRVDAEMKMIDAKSEPSQPVSWQQGKPGFSETSHGGNRRPGSYEVAVKSSIIQPSVSKTGSVKLGHGDAVVKSASSSPGSVKITSSLPASVTTNSKDLQNKTIGGIGTSETPLMTMKEEKSSGSSQSQNNSQSCSSDHAKTVVSAWKEDARSSTAGSMSVNKFSTGVPRTRKSSNGFVGSSMSGVHKETASAKPSSQSRNSTPDKLSQSGLTGERVVDVPPVDNINSHRLIVRLPNPGRSPVRSSSGGSFEDPSVMGSRASSPVISDKQDHCDRKAKGMGDACQATNIVGDVNTESWQSNDVKDGLAGLDEGNRSPAVVINEEHSRNTDDIVKSVNVSKGSCSSSSGSGKGVLGPGPKSSKPFDASFSSMNALVESCAKYSEVGASLSADDDIGMNLLASVAAGEISKSPGSSPARNSPTPDSLLGNNSKFKSSDDVACGQPGDGVNSDPEKQVDAAVVSQVKGDIHQISTPTVIDTLEDSKNLLHLPEQKSAGEPCGGFVASNVNSDQIAGTCLKSVGNANKTVVDESVAVSTRTKEVCPEVDESNHTRKKRKSSASVDNSGFKDYKMKLRSATCNEKKVDRASEKTAESSVVASDVIHAALNDGCDVDRTTSSKKTGKEIVDECLARSNLEMDREKLNKALEGSTHGISTVQQLPPVAAKHVEASLVRECEDDVAPGSYNNLCPDNLDGSRAEKIQNMEKRSILEPSGTYERMEQPSVTPPAFDNQVGASVSSLDLDHNNSDRIEETLERKDVFEHCTAVGAPHEESTTDPAQEMVKPMKSAGSKLSGTETDETECVSTAEAPSANVCGSDLAAKLDFDLNEGFAVDEGNQGDPAILAAPGSPSAGHLPSQLSFTVAPLSGGLPTPVTVAAAAKGPFVPPENLSSSKGALGWKGPADTSAFRRAEPRKVLEMPLNNADSPSSATSGGKHGRPPLDIDLNVPDERVLTDMSSQCSVRELGPGCGPINNQHLNHGKMFGLDLDLNRVDESTDNGQSAATGRGFEMPLMPARPSSSGGFPSGEVNVLRDFDLNSGPGLDEAAVEPASRNQHPKSNVPYLPPVNGLRMANAELGSLSPWFPSGNPYPAVPIPSFLPDREQQPYPIVATGGAQRTLGSAPSGTFGSDLYRGSVLSSSPAVAFTPAPPFQYPGLPFGTSFSLSSTSFSGGSAPIMDSSSGGPCFPAVPSQLVGPAGAVSSHYMRPYMMGLPEGTASVVADNSKWGRQSLDLNSGPGSADVEVRGDRLHSTSRPLSLANHQALAEEQLRIYQATGGTLKREVEGGWDANRFGYKPTSWQ